MATEDDTNSSNHPLFLHQNDNPGLIRISKKLTGSENYSTWRRSMMIALNAKNKLKIITKEFEEPEIGSTTRALWEMNNDMIISWILNTVSDQISYSLTFINSASDLWLELQEHYSQIDGHRIYQLANDITQLKQQECTIEVNYRKLKGLWDEIDALEAPYICTCTCSCDNGKVNGEREQRKRLLQFLMGLDDSYSNVRGQILLMQPLPSAAKAYGMVKQEEKQREGLTIKSQTPAAMSFIAQNNNYSLTTNLLHQIKLLPRKLVLRREFFCNYCKKEGHPKEECYKLVGYPLGHPLHGKVQPKSYDQKGNKSAGPTVNLAFGNDESPLMSPIDNYDNRAESAMFAKMEFLQN